MKERNEETMKYKICLLLLGGFVKLQVLGVDYIILPCSLHG